jgi:uncharacterized protein (DUF2062 family)
MFRRRNKREWFHNIREFLWPQMGWWRATRYVAHRVARLPGSPYSIAAGFACGAAISFTPFVGLHFVLAALLAWVIRANILASAIGTAVGNPWTFPFIWVWIYHLGNFLLGRQVSELPEIEYTFRFFVDFILERFFDIFIPCLVGGIPTAIVVWLVFYWPLKALVSAYQKRRVEKRANRRQEINGSLVGKETE